MPSTFASKLKDSGVEKDYQPLLAELNKFIKSKNCDQRTVYTAIQTQCEIERERLRACYSNKDAFDQYIAAMDILIKGQVSRDLREQYE
jgi:hypothetical protein